MFAVQHTVAATKVVPPECGRFPPGWHAYVSLNSVPWQPKH